MNFLKTLGFVNVPRKLLWNASHNSSNLYKISLCSQLPSKRTLYTKQSLLLDAFEERQKNARGALPNLVDYKRRLRDSLEADPKNLVFGTDLKKIIYLTQTDEDLDLLHKMIHRYCEQNNSIRFHTFTYGPEIMRLHYVLHKPIEAMSLIEDPYTTDLCNQIVTYLLLLDLLYENQMYQDVVRIFNFFSNKQLEGRKYPFCLINVFMAACYKMNTPESYKEALSLWQKLRESGKKTSFRSSCFLSMLAWKQNDNFIPIEILADHGDPKGKNILVMALAREQRFSDVLDFLKVFLYDKNPRIMNKKRIITHDTLDILEKEFQKSDLSKDFEKMKSQLIEHNFVTNEPLEKFICEEMEYQAKKKEKKRA